MNVKLTEVEYQHMIIALIRDCIEAHEELLDNDEYLDWNYFIDRLMTKAVYSDTSTVAGNINDKSRRVARTIKDKFLNEDDHYVTTMT